jgi:hypothetical protein
VAGESAQQQYERIRDRRQRWLRERWPWLVGLGAAAAVGFGVVFQVLAGLWWFGAMLGVGLVSSRLLAPPQSETAWQRGAEGERIVGAALDALQADGVTVLHDRKIPGSRANIDHLAVTAQAVFTVDAKRYRGKIAVRGARLYVAGRDRSKLLEQARRQQQVVADTLAKGGFTNVDVIPVLCFVGVEWPLLFPPRRVGEVRLCSPRRLRTTLQVPRDGGDAPSSTTRIAEHLAQRLRPAAGSTSPAADRPGVSGPSSPRAEPPSTAPTAMPFFTSTQPASSTPPEPSTGRPSAEETGTVACTCGAEMVMRTRRRDGARFFGCSRYPQCRHTRPSDA